jgi:hypothetical protein
MLKTVAYFIEIINWFKIVLSPTILGVILGYIIYYNFPTNYGLVASIALSSLGLILGILWANKIWKSKGTSFFMSRVEASPDIDEAIRPKIDNK